MELIISGKTYPVVDEVLILVHEQDMKIDRQAAEIANLKNRRENKVMFSEAIERAQKIDLLEKEIAELKAELQNRISLDEMQDYIYAVTLADCFVDLKPEHTLYESIRQDLKSSLAKIRKAKE